MATQLLCEVFARTLWTVVSDGYLREELLLGKTHLSSKILLQAEDVASMVVHVAHASTHGRSDRYLHTSDDQKLVLISGTRP